jgi:hypothetical protein
VTAQELSRIAGGIALIAVLVIAGLVAWSTLRAPEPEFVPQLAGGPAMGDMVGYVGRIDPETRTIDIAENPAGIRAVSFAVTNDTAITVHGKPSGLTDLAKDTPVRVSYEVRHDVKYVTAIQVVTEEPRPTQANVAPSGGAEVKGSVETKAAETKADDAKPAEAKPAEAKQAAAKPAEIQPPFEKKTVTETRPPGDRRPAGESKPVPDPKSAGDAGAVVNGKPAGDGRAMPGGKTLAETRPLQPAPPAPSAAPPAPAPRAPAPSSSVQAPAPPTVTSMPASQPPSPSAPGTPAPNAAARRPAESDVTDGTAAIDWLLKGPGRR